MKYLIIITILLTSTICSAGEGRHVWDTTYILGSALLNTSLMFGFDKGFLQSGLTTIACSMIKESVDGLYTAGYIQRTKFLDKFLDPFNGFDPGDIKLAGYGVALSTVSWFCNKQFAKNDNVKIYLNYNKLTVRVKF